MSHQGLTNNQVIEIRKKFGKNILPHKVQNSALAIFISQFKSPLIYVLLLAAIVSYFISKELFDVYLISTVIFVDVLMGFYQDYKAQKTLTALKNILQQTAIVIRDGVKKELNIEELVPGDLVVLGGGDKIPADGKLIEGVNFLVNEAILTGEEEAMEKNLLDKKNTLYMGTIVVSGSGIMKIDKIGANTEIGKIGKSLETIRDEKTPLQKKLEQFSKKLALLIIFICFIIFLVGIIWQNRDIWEMLRVAIVLAVAAIPEGLPIAITVVMALGMGRILKKRGLVKRLISIETLGSTNIICTDKTGTLTEGVMQVVKTDFTDEKNAQLAMILDNDQRSNLEISLLEYVKEKKLNPEEIFEKYPRVYQEPFNSESKHSLSVNKIGNDNISFMMGAPDIISNYCSLDHKAKKELLIKVENWAQDGLRVLGIAVKKGENVDEAKNKKGYDFVGLVGIKDPLRKEVKDVIAKAADAGITTKIVTGDFLGTALKVAMEIGLRTNPENVIEGKDLEKISDSELKNKINDLDVFARVTPHQKLRIVSILQMQDNTVAMTGDGVNDAPALKKADIGVVVGKNASDVAKETGDLILLDGNFKTIVAAIEEGRLVFSNIKKVVSYVLSNSFAEIILIFGAMMIGLHAPLTVVQILFIHLICDGPPDIMLSFEPAEKHLMKENPQELKKEDVFNNVSKMLTIAVSSLTGISALLIFWFFQKVVGDLALARTIVFAFIGLISLIYIFSFKSLKKSLFQTENFYQNKYLFWGVAYGWILMLLAVYMPTLNRFLGTVPLNLTHWIIIIGTGLFITIVVELIKLINYRRGRLWQ